MRWVTIAAVATLAACLSTEETLGQLSGTADGGDPATRELGVRSGTRLKAAWWTAEGGARVHAQTYDVEMGTSCQFRDTADGALRCVPNRTWSDPVYLDSACTEPAFHRVHLDVPCSGPFVTQLVSGCGGSTVSGIFRIDDVDPVTARIYERHAHGCMRAEPSDVLLEVQPATEISLDRWVAAAARRKPGSAGITVVEAVADDGARLDLDIEATGLGLSWQWFRGRWRVGQVFDVEDAYYADPACTEPLYAMSDLRSSGCAPQGVFGLSGGLACADDRLVEYFEVGAEIQPDVVFGLRANGTRCEALSPADVRLFKRGPPVPEADGLPVLPLVTLGEGPLVTRHLDPGNGLALFPGPPVFWNLERSEEGTCGPSSLADGSTRCVGNIPVVSGFADDDCGEPTATVLPCAAVDVVASGHGICGAFAVTRELDTLHEPGEPYDGPAYRNSEAGCVPTVAPEPRILVGPEIHDYSPFPELTLEIDP